MTRGTNPQCIIESCHDIRETLNNSDLAKRAEWHLEVVTDKGMDLKAHVENVNEIVVPADYVTKCNTLFKARALHYAAETVELRDDAWVLHMDEESYFNVENGHKIVDWCLQENYLIKVKGLMPSFANGLII